MPFSDDLVWSFSLPKQITTLWPLVNRFVHFNYRARPQVPGHQAMKGFDLFLFLQVDSYHKNEIFGLNQSPKPMETKSASNWNQLINTLLKLFVISIIAVYSFQILSPVITLVVWSLIFAIALAPVHTWLSAKLKNRKKLAAALITLSFLAVIVGPFGFVVDALVDNARHLAQTFNASTFENLTPDESIREWPLIGDRVYNGLVELSDDKQAFLARHKEQIIKSGQFVLGIIRSAAGTVLLFMGAMIIAGILLVYTADRQSLGITMGRRLAGEQGVEFAILMEKTVRSVVSGVLGVAIIQATLAGLGFFIMGIPFAGIWTLLVLFLALIQVGAAPVCIGAMIYGFSNYETTPAVLFLVWNLIVTLSDNVLKPILMGRGLDIPMLVVFLGAIGGMLSHGILGLFLGPVILGVGYRLAVIWLRGSEQNGVAAQEG
jgi:predicted PurR-regulated permease PerM